MTYSFNLIDQPWLSYVMPNGTTQELSLRDTLARAHEITAIFDQSPLVTAAVHRLLLAILHRNFGPASRAEWKSLWQAQRFDMEKLNTYFSQWKHRFDLFDGKYPFYQVVTFSGKQKEVEINDLLPELARGNTPTLFDHTTDQGTTVLSFSHAARALLALQMYKLGGLSGLGANYVDAPLARAVCFFVTGSCLFETLLLNLVRYHNDQPIPNTDNDSPTWEYEAHPNTAVPYGYLDYLTWQTLALRLVPTETPYGTGVVAKIQIALGRSFERGNFFDPEASYRKIAKAKTDQDPWVFVRFSEGRALWRDSTTLLRLSGQDTRPPVALSWIAELIGDEMIKTGTQYQLTAYGLCADQANILFWRHERIPLPVQYLSNESLLEKLEIALKGAEESAVVLRRAGNLLARRLLYPDRNDPPTAKAQVEEVNRLTQHLAFTERYWSMLEIPFGNVVRTLPHDTDAALTAWLTIIREVAVRAFEAATRDLDQSARVLRAVTEGRALLVSALSRILQPQS